MGKLESVENPRAIRFVPTFYKITDANQVSTLIENLRSLDGLVESDAAFPDGLKVDVWLGNSCADIYPQMHQSSGYTFYPADKNRVAKLNFPQRSRYVAIELSGEELLSLRTFSLHYVPKSEEEKENQESR